jgi:hypothetical protein
MPGRVHRRQGVEPALEHVPGTLQQNSVGRHHLPACKIVHHCPMRLRWWGWLIVGAVIGALTLWIALIPVPPDYACVHNDHHVECGTKVFP